MLLARSNRILAVALACSLAVACGDSDDDPEDLDQASVETLDSADFCDYESYDFREFAQVPGGITDIPLDQLANSQLFLTNAITNELEALGLDSESITPDLEVNVFYQFTEELIAEETCQAIVVAPGQVVYSCDWVTVEEYDFGTAIIDLVDRQENLVVLRGVVQGAATGNNSEERINRLVAKVFDAYEDELAACP